jgi:hypothetical protein
LSTVIASPSARAMQPIMSEDGNGHGCEAWYRTSPTSIPDSSITSRRTASSSVSPASTKPASADHIFAGKPA